MKIKGKVSFLFLVCFLITSLFVTISSFSKEKFQPATGTIEGYVFPKQAKPKVVVAVPHPNRPNDTIHRVATPNASGYFKLNNIPAGIQRIIYYPKDQTYKSRAKGITVVASQTVSAGSVTLELQ